MLPARGLTVLGTIAAFLAFGWSSASAGVFHVSLTGSDAIGDGSAATPFRTVQRGVVASDAASDGQDVIRVAAGTYAVPGVDEVVAIPDSVNISNLLVLGGHDALFVSRVPRTTIYIPQHTGSASAPDVDVADGNVSIDGFWFVFDGTPGPVGARQSGGIRVSGDGFVLNNNLVEVGSSSGPPDASGVQTSLGASLGGLTIANNAFDASAMNASNGIVVNPGSATSLTIANNQIGGANLYDGIRLDAVSSPAFTVADTSVSAANDDGLSATNLPATSTLSVIGSVFNDNASDGIALTNVGTVVLTGVTATGNDPGIFVNGAASFLDVDGIYSGNDDHGIQLVDIAGSATLVRTTADNNDADNDIVGDGLQALDGGDGDFFAIGGDLTADRVRFRDTDASGAGVSQRNGAFVQSVAGATVFLASGAQLAITGNRGDGLHIADGGTSVTLNGGLYSDNGRDGLVLGLAAGLAATGLTASGNGGHGLRANGVSGTFGPGNTLVANAGDGVYVGFGVGLQILGNAIFANGGLGIDLGPDGVTPNDPLDPDTGANELQNFPVINSATTDGTSTTIQGTLNSTPTTPFLIEFFSNSVCDPSLHGEGENFVGSTGVTTDSGGNATFTATFPGAVAVGQSVTSTASNATVGTSEFSECRIVSSPPPPPPPDTTPPTCVLETKTSSGITVRTEDDGSGLQSIVVLKSTNAVTTYPPFVPGTTDPVIVTSAKINTAQRSIVELRVTDVAGNVTLCDPVHVVLSIRRAKVGRSGAVGAAYGGLAQAESKIYLRNGRPGVRTIAIRVNGRLCRTVRLRSGQVRTLDVAARMRPGSVNTIAVIGRGRKGASFLLLIHD